MKQKEMTDKEILDKLSLVKNLRISHEYDVHFQRVDFNPNTGNYTIDGDNKMSFYGSGLRDVLIAFFKHPNYT